MATAEERRRTAPIRRRDADGVSRGYAASPGHRDRARRGGSTHRRSTMPGTGDAETDRRELATLDAALDETRRGDRSAA